MHTHQMHRTAQLRLLEIVDFPMETSSLLPLAACDVMLMQCKQRIVQGRWKQPYKKKRSCGE